MLSKFKWIILVLFSAVAIISCTDEEEKLDGAELTNYPDLEQLLKEEWNRDSARTYLKVSRTEAGADSSQVESADMPWGIIDSIFIKANIQKKELDRHYSIDIMTDTLDETVTLYYKSLTDYDYTRSISIVSEAGSNDLKNVFFDAEEKKNDLLQKVLFVPNKLMQIQRRSKGKIEVDTYYFPE